MEIILDDEKRLIEEYRKVKQHGFGKIDASVSTDNKLNTKIIIWAGCSFIFIIKKDVYLDRREII